MWWLLLLLTVLPAMAQDEEPIEENFDDIDLQTLQALEEELPSSDNISPVYTPKPNKMESPVVHVEEKTIEESGFGYGVILAGKTLIRISDDKAFKITEDLTTRYKMQEDELGFKHLVDKNKNIFYKTDSVNIISINPELVLYEPPHRYTPAPVQISRAEYDFRLKLRPEVSFYAGTVQGNYMADLFNDQTAASGYTTQYGLHYFTQWKLPILVGGVVHFEKSFYKLKGDGSVNYSALSFGPQFKTKNFDFLGLTLRLQTQFRVSPFANATADSNTGHEAYKFNSGDFLTSIEHPFENSWGEFVVGFFYQAQWLNLKSQTKNVSVSPSNEINKSFGLSFAQVFQ
jgi:hypothetical protein